jgi:hypothetical protein
VSAVPGKHNNNRNGPIKTMMKKKKQAAKGDGDGTKPSQKIKPDAPRHHIRES